MATFWKRMTQAYGTLWINQYGEVPNRTWENALADLSQDQIANGVKRDGLRIKKRVDDGITAYPPSVDEFKAMCLQTERPATGAYRLFTPTVRNDVVLGKEAGLNRCAQLRAELGL